MKILILGSTGMVGQGVLRECLLDSQVEKVLVINRNSLNLSHEKLKEVIQKQTTDISSLTQELADYDACFFCLGVSALGMSEEKYKEVTYDLTLDLAKALAKVNSRMSFIYVSGASTDSSEKGSIMWARVKGKTENDLLKLPFEHKYMFRPGFIQPMNGETSKVGWYNLIYKISKPVSSLICKFLPAYSTNTEIIGRAMIKAVKNKDNRSIFENIDINNLVA